MSTALPARYSLDQPGRGGGAPMATWGQITAEVPVMAATMHAYWEQIAVVLPHRMGGSRTRHHLTTRYSSSTLCGGVAPQFGSAGSWCRGRLVVQQKRLRP